MRTRTPVALACSLLAVAAACGGSPASDPLVACAANGSCPSGFVCASDNTCWKPPIPAAPGTPQNVKAVRTSDGSISVSWNAVDRATSYVVTRSSQPGSPTTLPATTQTSLVDKTAVRTQSYSYTVSALGPGGSSPGSAAAVVGGAPFPPPAPSAVVATPFARHIQIGWSTGFNDVGVFRSATSGGPYTLIATVHPTFAPSYDDIGLADSTTYFYVVQGFASDGFPGDRSVEVSAKTAPPPPANLTAKLVPFSSRVTVSWDPVPGADGYCVKFFGPGTCSFPTTTATTFDSGSLGPAATFDIRVSAANSIPGRFGLVESVDAGPLRITTPPFAPFPTLLVDSASSTLTWAPVPAARSYAILRSLDGPTQSGFLPPSTLVQIGTTTDTRFADIGPFEDWSQYSYAVASVDLNGNGGDPSFPISRQTAGPPDQENLGTAPLALARADSAHDAGQTFVVGQSGILAGLELSTAGTFASTLLDVFNGPLPLASMFVSFPPSGSPCCQPLGEGLPGRAFVPLDDFFTHVPVSVGQVLRFRLHTTGGGLDLGRSADTYGPGSLFTAGSAVPGTDLVFKTFVKPATGPFTAGVLVPFPGVRRLALAWTASPGAISYSLQRASKVGGPYAEIANTRQANVVDAPLDPGSRFFYRVQATGPNGITDTSAPIEAGPLASDADQANPGDGSGSVLVNEPTFSYAAQSVTIGRTGTLAAIQFTASAAEAGVIGQVSATLIVRDDTGTLLLQQQTTLNLEGACGPAGCGIPALDPASPMLQTVDLSASRLAVTAGEVLHFEVRSPFGFPFLVGDGADLYPGGTESVNGVAIPGRDLAFQVLIQ